MQFSLNSAVSTRWTSAASTAHSGSCSSSGSSGGAGGSTARQCVAVCAANPRYSGCKVAHCGPHAPQDPPPAYLELRQQLNQQHWQQQQQQHSYQQQHQHGSSLKSGPRPAQDVCRAISRQLKEADSTEQVLGLVLRHTSVFNEINTALAFSQLARHLRFESAANRSAALMHDGYHQLLQLSIRRAAGLKPRQVAMTLTSLAWIYCPQDHAATPTAPEHSNSINSSAGGTSSIADEGSTLDDVPCGQLLQQQQQQQEQQVLLDCLSQRLQQQLEVMEPEDICHCLWALTKLSALSPQLLAAATQHSLAAGWLHLLTAKPLSSLLWVHAQLQLQLQEAAGEEQQQQEQRQGQVVHGAGDFEALQQLLPHLLCGVMHELSQPGFLATWTPQEVSMLLWSCAVLGVPLEQHIQPSSAQVQQQDQQGGPKQHEQEQLLPPLPLSVLHQLCQLAQQHVVQFSPQGMAMVCWSLSKLLAAAAAAQSGAVGDMSPPQPGATQQLRLNSQHQPKFAAVLPAALQQDLAGLFDTFVSTAAVQLRYFKPQEVANLFAACSRLQLPVHKPLMASAAAYITSVPHLLSGRDVAELLLAYVQQKASPGPAVLRALLHRTGQLSPVLTPYQLVALAWGFTEVAAAHSGSKPGWQMVDSSSSSSSRADLPVLDSQLQAECHAAARCLLDIVADRLAAAAATCSSPGLQQAWCATFPGSQGLPKQSLLLAAAISGSGYGCCSSKGGSWNSSAAAAVAAYDCQQQERQPLLLSAVLQQLQQVAPTSSGPAAVHVLYRLAKLQAALTPAGDSGDGPAAGLLQQLVPVYTTAGAQLLSSLHNLTSSELVLAVWAVLKLDAVLGNSCVAGHDKDQQQQQQQQQSGSIEVDAEGQASVPNTPERPDPAALVDLVLRQLHEQDDIARLPAHLLSCLFRCCAAVDCLPEAGPLQALLQAADNRLLQMDGGQLVILLHALGRSQQRLLLQQWGPQQQPQQQQQQGKQQMHGAALLQTRHVLQRHAHLISQVAERLQHLLHQQWMHYGNQLQPNHGPGSSSFSNRGPAVLRAEQQLGLKPQQLISLAAACSRIPQLQCSELLLLVAEAWHLLVAAGGVSAHQALLMCRTLAGSQSRMMAQDSQAQQPVLQAQQQPAVLTPQLHQLLQQAAVLFSQQLSYGAEAQQQQQQQVQHGNDQAPAWVQEGAAAVSPGTMVLAVRVFAGLRYQPAPQLMLKLCKQLHAALPRLQDYQLVQALHALAHLGMPLHSLAAATTQQLYHRQHKQQQWQRLPCVLALQLLWSALLCGLKAPQPVYSKRCRQLLVMLTHLVVDMPEQQLMQQPQLLIAALQVRQMLCLQQYKQLRLVLEGLRVALPQENLLTSQLQLLTQLLLPDTLVGRSRREALMQLLDSDKEQQVVFLRQALASSTATQQEQQQQSVQQLLPKLQPMLPIWLHHQLQQVGLQHLSRQVVAAQAAAGVSPAVAKFRHISTGDIALLLLPTSELPQQKERPHQQLVTSLSSSGSAAGSSSCRGLAVVLELGSSLSVNTGKLLGRSLVRNACLEAQGFKVCTLQLDCWLPDWLLQQLSKPETRSAARGLVARRQKQLQQLVGLLQQSAQHTVDDGAQ